MKVVKKLVWFSIWILLAALAVLVVLMELAPRSGAARFLEGYVGKPYQSARAGTVNLWYQVRRVTFGTPVPAKEEPEEPAKPEVAEKKASAPAPAPAAPAEPTFSTATWYSRKRVSDSDCRGKVVLVCEWSADVPESVEALPRIQQLAEGFEGKPLVVVASHRGGNAEKAKKALAKVGVTIPACEGGRLANAPQGTGSYPFIYVVDHKGKVRYRGRSDRPATEALVNAFTDYVLKK